MSEIYKAVVKKIEEDGVIHVLIPDLMLTSNTEPDTFLKCSPMVDYHFFPVEEGDNVAVFFIGNMKTPFWLCKWATSDFLSDKSVAHDNKGLFTIYKDGVYSIQVDQNNKKITIISDKASATIETSGDITVQNEKVKITLKNTGDMTATNDKITVSLQNSGAMDLGNGSGKISITSGGDIELNGNTKSFVTHDELDLAIQTFVSAINLHTHAVPGAMAGGPGLPTSPPIATMTIDISSSKTNTIKTNG